MTSNNSKYEERIEDSNHNNCRVWKECLIKRADLSIDMLDPVYWQVNSTNWRKPVGLYFNRMDWVTEASSNFQRRLANDEVTKQGSLIESFWYFGRGVCMDPRKHSSYDKQSKDEVIQAAVNVLKASELNEQEQVDDDSTLREYVAYVVTRFEENLEDEIGHMNRVDPA